MKLKNALKKIIHSVCLISVLFLSVFFVFPPVEVYADTYTVWLTSNASGTRTFYLYACYYDGTTAFNVAIDTLNNGGAKYWSLDGSYIYCISCGKNKIRDAYATLSSDPSNPTFISSPYYLYISDSTTDSSTSYYFYIDPSAIATPTPEPTPTPTPAPSSPTPDANAEAFFGKLGSDAQNGVGAILTAWNAASSHFYTGVLFIVIPVFLGIVSLIASFFFGGGDDD